MRTKFVKVIGYGLFQLTTSVQRLCYELELELRLSALSQTETVYYREVEVMVELDKHLTTLFAIDTGVVLDSA